MKFALRLALIAGLSGFGGAVSAATFDLTGTIRDFSDTHPDFEAPCCSGHVTGLVDDDLGADKNPDFAAPDGTAQILNSASFDQWFEDVPGVNQSQSLQITLDNTITADPNVYTYSNSSFFPIDGQLMGNQGRSHNYHFTFEIHSMFTYMGGETFSFTGDDDVWVFINDKLVVDLGGVHGAINGSVDLDTLGLTIGEDYDFDLFFAERHTTHSNFRIDTSIQLVNEVPIPAALPLLAGGLGLITLMGRRRKS